MKLSPAVRSAEASTVTIALFLSFFARDGRYQLPTSAVFLCALLFLALRSASSRLRLSVWPISPLCLWYVVSAMLGESPGDSLPQLLNFLGWSGTALLAAQFDLRWFVQRWRNASKLLLTVSFATIATDTLISTSTFSDVFNSKNHAGFAIALSAMALSTTPARRKRLFAWRSFVLAISIWSCLQINAQTGLVLVILTTVYILTSDRVLTSRYRLLTMATLVAIAPLGLIAFVNSSTASTLASALGRDLSLSGRTALWSASIDAWKHQPAFGYGFGSVWSDSSQAPAATIIRVAQANGFADPASSVVYSHNGFIDTLLETGAVGLALLLAMMLNLGRNSVFLVASSRGSSESDATAAFGALILIVVANLTESRTFNDAAILILLSLAASCSAEAHRRRTTLRRMRFDDHQQLAPSARVELNG